MSGRIVVATRNERKGVEMIRILSELTHNSCEFATLRDFPEFPETPETAESYVGNAVLKAEAAVSAIGLTCLADDAGLEIDHLGGEPGVHSKRFQGEETSFDEKIAKILELLDGVPRERRTARFRCAIALAQPHAATVLFESVCAGAIANKPKGHGGFGYDSIFIPSGSDQTFAEMSPDAKNQVSHRGKVLREFAIWLVANARPNEGFVREESNR